MITECAQLEVVNEKEVAKPAANLMKELKQLREQLSDEQLDQFTFSDLKNDESDIIPYEKLKAIMHLKGMDDKDQTDSWDSASKQDQDALVFHDDNELGIFNTEVAMNSNEIRSRYFKKMQKSDFKLTTE